MGLKKSEDLERITMQELGAPGPDSGTWDSTNLNAQGSVVKDLARLEISWFGSLRIVCVAEGEARWD